MTDRTDHRAAAERMLADADPWAAQAGEPTPEAGELSCLAYAQVHALLAIHDALTAADRYAANEERQREAGAGCPTLIECLRTLEATRPGTDDRPFDAAYVDGLNTAYDHLRSVLVDHGAPVRMLDVADEPETSEAAEWLSLDEDDPLDEDDHRDRLASDGSRWTRRAHLWCPESCACHEGSWKLDQIDARFGPLTFAPDADGAPSVTAPVADGPADDAVDGEEGERRYLNAQTGPETLLCPECGHDIDEHGWEADYAITCCLACDDPADCRKAPSGIARALIERAVSIERTRLTFQLRLTTSSVQDSGDLTELDALADAWEAGTNG